MRIVLEQFYRFDQQRTRESSGNGLGLAICRSIVRAYYGSIDVKSLSGSEVTFPVILSICENADVGVSPDSMTS